MMKIIFIFLSLLFFSIKSEAQDEMYTIDSLLDKTASKNPGHLTKIKIGTRKTGTAYFYLKSNKVLYSIVDRISFYNSQKKRDSSCEYKYFFLNDKLVKVIHNRSKERPNNHGFVYLYFKDGRLIGRKEFKDYPITDVEYITRESSLLFTKAKNLSTNK